MDILLSIVYIIALLFIIKKWSFFQNSGIRFQSISAIFLIKILFSFLLYFIYDQFYGYQSDSYYFFNDAQIIYKELKNNTADLFSIITSIGYSDFEHESILRETSFWYKKYDYGLYNDNRTLIRLNLIFSIISHGSYHIHSIFMCFITLIGFVGIYRAFCSYLQQIKNLLFFAVFLAPSVLFWGSGIFKEGILIFALGLLFFSLQKIYSNNYSLKSIIILFFTIGILLVTKIYFLLGLIPFLILFFLFRNSNKHLIIKILGIHIVCVSIAFGLKYIDNSLDIPQYFVMKQGDFINVANEQTSKNFIDFQKLENNLGAFILASPKAILNTTFKPFLWESKNSLAILSSIENVLLLLIPLALIFYTRKINSTQKFWIYGLLSFVMLLFIIIGLTVPISGAIVRYKMPLIPFILVLFLLLMDQNKIRELNWVNKIINLKI